MSFMKGQMSWRWWLPCIWRQKDGLVKWVSYNGPHFFFFIWINSTCDSRDWTLVVPWNWNASAHEIFSGDRIKVKVRCAKYKKKNTKSPWVFYSSQRRPKNRAFSKLGSSFPSDFYLRTSKQIHSLLATPLPFLFQNDENSLKW